jgi:hypothetical protein
MTSVFRLKYLKIAISFSQASKTRNYALLGVSNQKPDGKKTYFFPSIPPKRFYNTQKININSYILDLYFKKNNEEKKIKYNIHGKALMITKSYFSWQWLTIVII